jgi:hypothetical protein
LVQSTAKMRTLHALLVVVAVGCSGSVATVDGDGGGQGADGGGADGRASDAADTHDGAVFISDGAACITIDPSSAEVSCSGDSDCKEFPGGTICSGGCACSGTAINTASYAKYVDELKSITTLACPCHAAGQPRCVQGACILCGYGAPGCPDGG